MVSRNCAECGAAFTPGSGTPQRFCSDTCRYRQRDRLTYVSPPPLRLQCRACGTWWNRPVTRGRPAHRCLSCRGVAP